MGTKIIITSEQGEGGASSADKVSYDNTSSGLAATDVQSAVDELTENKADKTEISNVVKAPQTAEVGQVLAVKAVDEEGRPTEWKVVDQSGGGGDNNFDVSQYVKYETTTEFVSGEKSAYIRGWDKSKTPFDIIAPRSHNLIKEPSKSDLVRNVPKESTHWVYLTIPQELVGKPISLSYRNNNSERVDVYNNGWITTYRTMDGRRCYDGIIVRSTEALAVVYVNSYSSTATAYNTSEYQIEDNPVCTNYVPYAEPATITITDETPQMLKIDSSFDRVFTSEQQLQVTYLEGKETVVGTWFDGRPIYETICIFKPGEINVSDTSWVTKKLPENARIIHLQGRAYMGGANFYFNDVSVFRIGVTNPYSSPGIPTTASSYFSSSTAVIKVQYTKETDESTNTFLPEKLLG